LPPWRNVSKQTPVLHDQLGTREVSEVVYDDRVEAREITATDARLCGAVCIPVLGDADLVDL